MKKSIIGALLLTAVIAHAQEGKVGINTDAPKATIDIQPNANNAKAEAKTNEGILAPRLSKTRIANIETPVEGTLVYATDETTSPISAYTGSNVKVAKITEKGYYFYNGAEWVKIQYKTEGSKWTNDSTVSGVKLTNLSDGITSRVETNTFNIYDNGNIGIGTNYSNAGITLSRENKVPNANMGAANDFHFNYYDNDSDLADASSLVFYRVGGTKNSMKNIRNGAILGNLVFGGSYNNKHWQNLSYINSHYLGDGNTALSNLKFTVSDKPSSSLYINEKGYIGINTENPEAEMDIKGIGITGDTQSFRIRNSDDQNNIVVLDNGKVSIGASLNNMKARFAVLGENINGKYHAFAVNEDFSTIAWRSIKATDPLYKASLYVSGGIDDTNDANTTTNRSALIWGIGNEHKGIIYAGRPINGSSEDGYLAFGTASKSVNSNMLERMRIDQNGNIGIGIDTPTEKLDVNGKIKATSLAQSGAGDRVVYADENGVLKTGVSAAANVKLATGTNIKCEAGTSGTMNFGSVTIGGEAKEAFGFCMKNSAGEYKWFYIYGGAGVTTGNGGAFGTGL